MNLEENKTRKPRPILCIELLNTFSKKEVEDLKELIACRYFNTDRYVIKLLDVLRKSVLNKQTFTEEVECNVYRKVFDDIAAPKRTLDKKQKGLLNAKMNVLLRLTEQFLSIETMKTHDIHKCELLYPPLIERNQYLLFNRHITKDKKQLKEQVAKGRLWYVQAHRIEDNVLNYLYRTGNIVKEDNLPDLIYNLDVSYLLNKLYLHATALSLKRSSQKKEYDFSLTEKLADLMDMPQYIGHPLMVVYRTAIKLLETQDAEIYSHLLESLDKYTDVIPIDLLKEFYLIANNHCIYQLSSGQLSYTENLFELYNIMHHKNLLIDNGFIPIVPLKNMITIGCRVGEFEWAKEIIEHYRSFIKKDIRDNVCHFSYATVAFHEKDYETAHDRYSQAGRINTTYDINTRVAILKCLYEKEKDYNEYTMTAFRSADSFFKLNKELPQRSKTGYRNFITILMTLYRIRHREGARTVEWAREQLAEQEVNSDKRWLLEKIEELKGRKKRSW